jgi:translocation and assembly module TamB
MQWPEHPNDATARIAIAAQGAINGIALPNAAQNLGRDLTWSVEGQAAPDGSIAELTHLAAHGAGVDVDGAGRMAEMGRVLSGQVHASVADLLPLTGIFGHPIAGQLNLKVVAEQQTTDLVTAKIDGSLDKLRAGMPAADALAGGMLTISGSAQRGADGVLVLDALSVKGTGADLSASGRFESATGHFTVTLDAVIPSLQPVGKELGSPLAGRLAAHVAADGPLEQPQVQAYLEGSNLTSGTAVLDSLRLDAKIANPTQPQVSITGAFSASGLEGMLGAEAQLGDQSDLAVRKLSIKAAGGSVDGDLNVNLVTLLTSGTLGARLPDLAPWSRLAGIPLAGSIELQAKLAALRGQAVDLTLNGEGLAIGSGGGRIALGRIAASAKIADVLGTPSGSGQVALAGGTFASGNLAKALLNVDSAGPGRFTYRADASGYVQAPLTVALNGTADITPRSGTFELQLARLNGTLGTDKLQLTRTLTLSARGNDLAMSGLALTYGHGQISGDASRRGAAVSLQLRGHDLDLASFTRLAGHSEAGGTLGFEASVNGTLAAPQGRFTVAGRNLRFARPKQRLPTLRLDLSGNWNGRDISLNGHVRGLKGDALTISGEAPLVFTQSPFGITLPPQGRLALRLQGAGEIGNITDLLPLGEDRITGHFTLDGGVTGTLAAPAASGHLTITEGRYANFATGAVLTHLRTDVSGDGDRVAVREFSANDTGSGTLSARGNFVLTGAAPTADLTATLNNFRILGRDDAVLTGSGNVAIAGSVASPKVSAQLSTGQGDLRIPDSLPLSVTKLQVVEINSRTPKRPPPRAARATTGAGSAKASPPPALPATLDINITLPGQIFVRGRGLDSEWRGKLAVTGTSATPQILGSLEVVRGTFDILGKTFKVTRGTISFDGAKTLDPTLDIVTEVVAGDIVAQVLVSGSASAPKIRMSSTPAMPQEQILSYVLFGRASTQITAAEGIQVAQAAATLAGGGAGMLDKLRGGLGLDRLMLGSSQTGNASSNLNPAAGGSNTGGTSVSGGKYLAEGVYVGASQGLTPQSSKVVVEIEVRPHVTVQGDFSQTGGSGLGLNYKYDY